MKLKRVIAIACTAAMTASLISGCGGSSDEGQKEAAVSYTHLTLPTNREV